MKDENLLERIVLNPNIMAVIFTLEGLPWQNAMRL